MHLQQEDNANGRVALERLGYQVIPMPIAKKKTA